MDFRVREQGGLVHWLDAPKTGRRRFGNPTGGPWDTESAKLVQALLPNGNLLEILNGWAVVELPEGGSLAVVGIDGYLTFNSRSYPLGVRLSVATGSSVRIQGRCVTASVSTENAQDMRLDWRPEQSQTMRYLPTSENAEELLGIVTPKFTRLGVRISSELGTASELPSEPICVGAIQHTPDGGMIIVGPDGPTIGGYPRLGTIIEADLHLVPRWAIGSQVRFVAVDFEAATYALDMRSEQLDSALRQIRISQIQI
ncbi:MAG TPA: hypothetical protein VJ835_00955 [Fimbriimonadaceae bacterium]|nr:hypothetical protein [Fimbriimonadaceae bacterium]